MKRYAAVLRVPHVAALIAATLLARFPIGINALAIMLYLRAERGSFAVAGAVAGALAAGSGIGAPIQGRLVDAFGQRRVLLPLGFIHAAALGAIVATAEAGAPIAGAGRAAACWPASRSRRRRRCCARCGRLCCASGQELIPAAYALDSVLIELIFVLGPLLTAVIATLLSPPAALIVSAVSVIVGHADVHGAPAVARAAAGPQPPACRAARRARIAGRPDARADVATRR